MSFLPSPFYDINKTFLENTQSDPIQLPDAPTRFWKPVSTWKSFLGYSVASPVGVAACAATTSRGIIALAQLGFDILTYKTIRSQVYVGHTMPNIVYLDIPNQLTERRLLRPILSTPYPFPSDRIAISNSFGNACFAPNRIAEDIAKSKAALLKGQVLIVSIYGENDNNKDAVTDFITVAQLAQQAGADVIELNFSCPNLASKMGPIYLDAESVYTVTKAVVLALGTLPVIIKIGLFPNHQSPASVLIAAARAGAVGVSAINAPAVRVVTLSGKPAFGKRYYSGVSGNPIRQLALEFISKIARINRKHRLGLAIVGIGGITRPNHFLEFQQAGADVALTATAVLWNPFLGLHYQELG